MLKGNERGNEEENYPQVSRESEYFLDRGSEKDKKENFITAQARNRTGGPTMATLDFTTKPLALNSLCELR